MGIKGFDPVSFQRHKGYETSADHLVINTDNAVKVIQQSMLWNTFFKKSDISAHSSIQQSHWPDVLAFYLQ